MPPEGAVRTESRQATSALNPLIRLVSFSARNRTFNGDLCINSKEIRFAVEHTMLLKLIYLQDIENLMVDYEYYIQDILESTKTTTLYLQRAKMEEVSHYSLCPKHFRRDTF